LKKWPTDNAKKITLFRCWIECDLSDLEDVLSESDEFIPHGDASQSEDNTNNA
jgi:hypothetical protein